jgi:type II secretory pathway pseudopilin PulG
MALTNFEEDQFDQDDLGGEVPPEPERKPSNRNFIIAIAVVGAIFILSLILLLLLGPGLLANQQAAQQEQAAQINAANTATALAATALVQAQQATLLARTTVAPTATRALPTKTPVVVVQTNTPGATTSLSDAELATVSALQTEMAGKGGGATPAPTSTALPTSGFADEVGLPLMAGLAIVLVVVILLSRRLRLSSR